MTIALGILAADGVVIAADTQEGTGFAGGTKATGRKIFTRLDPTENRGISITGAGDADHLDGLAEELAESFREATNPENAVAAIREKHRAFYTQNMLPLHVLALDEQPRTETILASTWGQHKCLLIGRQMMMHHAKEYAVVGAGRQHAAMLLNSIFPLKYDMSTQLAAYFAAYVIFHVKQFVEGCGKGTHVTILEGGQGSYLSEWAVAELEQCFASYLQLEGTMVNYILGRPLEDGSEAQAEILGRLETIRERVEKSHSVDAEEFGLTWRDAPRSPTSIFAFQRIGGRAVFKRSIPRGPAEPQAIQ